MCKTNPSVRRQNIMGLFLAVSVRLAVDLGYTGYREQTVIFTEFTVTQWVTPTRRVLIEIGRPLVTNGPVQLG